MIKFISKTNLDRLIDNHKNNKGLPILTDAVFITRKHFDEYVKGLPQDYDALKICFVRFESNPPDPDRILEAGNNLTQVSLIFVPVKNTDQSTWTSTGVTDQNDVLRTLCVCEPNIDDQNNTGVVPPKNGEESSPDD